MKIKDIIKTVAVYLGKENAVHYLEGGTAEGDTLSVIDTMVRCANLVISELAWGYIPMEKTETINSNGKIYYADLSERILQVSGVYDCYGNKLNYKIHGDNMETPIGEVTVVYKYAPANYGLEDEIGYTEKDVACRIIAYGAAAEFCLTEKGYEESRMWRSRFTDAMSLSCLPHHAKLKGRCWA